MSGRRPLIRLLLDTKRHLTTQAHSDRWNSLVTPLKGTRAAPGTYTVKDNILTKGSTTCGSEMLSQFESPFDATVVRLLNKQGYSMVGKANLDQFGMGSSNTNSIYGASTNPLFTEDYVTGGSSGGSAASVAGNLCEFSLGTDTGGSVRLPASNCGIYGFKPSYGMISRWGVIPYSQTLDTVGILARSVGVVEQVFKVLGVEDSKDPTSLPQTVRSEVGDLAAKRDKSKKHYTFGIPQEFLVEELTVEARTKLISVAEQLIDMGHRIVEVSVPSIERSLSAYYTIATAEAASNLARYDGIRYGKQGNTTDIRSTALGQEVQRRIILGNYTISSDSGDHYARATELRKQVVDEFNDIFYLPNRLVSDAGTFNEGGCDFLLAPTTINKPVKVEQFLQEERKNILQSYTNDILTTPISLAGLPAISVPIADNGENSISTQGIQLIGQYGDDMSVLKVAKLL